ncbi:glycosyltransferase [Actinophytocola algeriensis]|uniref:UDP:flavonoid glycosyltransferase YjiC (YdhE family) n=1 Tax=Actinophytocola algeriensis TaxID=1768010 RepID=A0A7W7Q615_9PSEU|nr:glycosyltransferase [Actinophytocola algeriensis]MBB4907478.1 UDP:flavonoid glycosyltransferase YjiC (YdhE family) [Actinophytocola algeriensis]MBE1479508.1 UDP:flavonoid glycosyltransferase YjiC (YdhE family) [Actinophytocola algeriensis]
MRVLFASLASVGHTYPLIPLAVAARDAGHEVHFAAGAEVHPPLAANGLNPFRPADSFYEIYAEDLAPELDRLRPDLVIHEWGLPGAATAAREAGIPGLWHGFGRRYPDGIGLERPAGGVHLDICPPSIQDKDFLAAERTVPLRPVPFSEPGETFDGPLIYLTLGTAFGTAELLTTAIHGLAKLGRPVVVATGRVDPRDLGPLPADVTVRKWLPQAGLVPHADLVVHHGGSGTTLGALAAGVPQLVLPQGADQFANAAALTEAGAAITVDDVAAIADSAAAIGAGHRAAARALADEIARLPAPADVARQLPDLAGR